MPVPTANTLRFSDVCLEIYGSSSTSGRTLMTAFANANPAGFNPSYNTGLNSLLRFRGYTHAANPLAPTGLFQSGSDGMRFYFSWNAMVNATDYRVYIDGQFIRNTGGDTNSSFSGNQFQTYQVQITSVNGGFESGFSAAVGMSQGFSSE